MKNIEAINGMDSDLKAALQASCDMLANGIRDPEAARRSRERMARARDEIRQRCGVQNVVVDLVRQGRESR